MNKKVAKSVTAFAVCAVLAAGSVSVLPESAVNFSAVQANAATSQSFQYYSYTPRTYSKAAHGNQYLTANFQVKEFACEDGSDTILIDLALVERLQALRDYFGAAIIIDSGYRTESHNEDVGGSSGSLHVDGRAADIIISGVTPAQIRSYANSIGLSYEIYKNDTPHVPGSTQHVDTWDVLNPKNFYE